MSAWQETVMPQLETDYHVTSLGIPYITMRQIPIPTRKEIENSIRDLFSFFNGCRSELSG